MSAYDVNAALDRAENAFGENEHQEFPLGKPGPHSFAILSAEGVKAKGSGLPMYKLRLKITDEQCSDVWCNVPIPWEGRTAKANEVLERKIIGFFKAIGYDRASKGLPLSQIDVAKLVGSEGRVVLKRKQDEGYPEKNEPQWERVAPPAGPVPDPNVAAAGVPNNVEPDF